MGLQKKSKFLQRFRERYSLRIHMCAILLATAASGALASKLLLLAQVENPSIRYPFAVLFSYSIFFISIKLWLIYVTPSADSVSGSNFVDAIDLPVILSSGNSSGYVTPVHGGGGEFAGGGASGSFDVDANAATESVTAVALSDASFGTSYDVGDGVGDGIGDAVGGVGDALGDDGGLVILVVVALLSIVLVVVLGASAYFIYQAPAILSEVALQSVLAASLTKQTKVMAQSDWMGSVLKATWRPFACTLLAALICGVVLHTYFPEAIRLADIWK